MPIKTCGDGSILRAGQINAGLRNLGTSWAWNTGYNGAYRIAVRPYYAPGNPTYQGLTMWLGMAGESTHAVAVTTVQSGQYYCGGGFQGGNYTSKAVCDCVAQGLERFLEFTAAYGMAANNEVCPPGGTSFSWASVFNNHLRLADIRNSVVTAISNGQSYNPATPPSTPPNPPPATPPAGPPDSGDAPTPCGILDIPCNLRALFIPNPTAWRDNLDNLRSIASTRFPFSLYTAGTTTSGDYRTYQLGDNELPVAFTWGLNLGGDTPILRSIIDMIGIGIGMFAGIAALRRIL